MDIDDALILRQAREIQRLAVDGERARELALELNALLEAAVAISDDAAFDDDPGGFATFLWRLRDKGSA